MDYILDRPRYTDQERALRASLVERAHSLVPLLAANSGRTETERRTPEESIDPIREAGIFRLMQPRRFGGLQTDFRAKLEVTRKLARGCGSTAWAVSLMNGSAYLAGRGRSRPRRARRRATPRSRSPARRPPPAGAGRCW